MKEIVHHYRFLDCAGGLHSQRQIRLMGLSQRVEPRGGWTVVELVSDDGIDLIARGESRCSRLDNYSKKLGRLIASGRAWKQVRDA